MTISVAVSVQAQATAATLNPIAETRIAFMGPPGRCGSDASSLPDFVAHRQQWASAGPARCVNAARGAPAIVANLTFRRPAEPVHLPLQCPHLFTHPRHHLPTKPKPNRAIPEITRIMMRS